VAKVGAVQFLGPVPDHGGTQGSDKRIGS
jgi:hypothetical protein